MRLLLPLSSPFLFFLHYPATTPIYPLSLHDALPIFSQRPGSLFVLPPKAQSPTQLATKASDPAIAARADGDRKSTRLNSSHEWISYAVFCLKKKKSR